MRQVELLVTNPGKHPVEKGHRTFEPGQTNILVRDLEARELSAAHRLHVQHVAVHEDQEQPIDLEAAERDLAGAEEELHAASARLEAEGPRLT